MWRYLMLFSEGATGDEPMTYRIAAYCSTTELYKLYNHVPLNIEYVILETTK